MFGRPLCACTYAVGWEHDFNARAKAYIRRTTKTSRLPKLCASCNLKSLRQRKSNLSVRSKRGYPPSPVEKSELQMACIHMLFAPGIIINSGLGFGLSVTEGGNHYQNPSSRDTL